MIQPYIRALKDSNTDVRARAAETLGNHRVRRAVEPLLAALQDPEWSVVFHAADALGKIRDPRAVRPLLLAAARKGKMFESHVAIRDISKALMSIGKSSLQPALGALRHQHPRVRVAAAATLARLHDRRAIRPLIRALTDSDQKVREWAKVALGQFGRAAIRPLMVALRKHDLHVKGWREEVGQTAWALAEVGSPAVPALMRALLDPKVKVREGAAAALGEIRDLRAVNPLIKRLTYPMWRVRWQSAIALGKIGDPRAVEPLISVLLSDHDPRVRDQAARALWKLEDRRAVSPLISALKDPDPHVRWAAAGALGAIGDRRAVIPLCELLRHHAESSKWWEGVGGPANALGRLGDTRAVKPLIGALKHPHGETRWGAALALGKLKDRRAVKPLIAVLKSRDPRAPKGAAIIALGEIRDRRAVRPILAAHKTITHGPEFAIEALGKIQGAGALKRLLQALQRDKTRWRAKQALQCIPVEAMASDLVPLLHGDDRLLQWKAAELLVKVRQPEAVEFLLKQLKDGYPGSRERAAEMLGGVRTTRVIRCLISALAGGEIGPSVSEALVKIGTPAVQPLIRALGSPDRSTRWWAAEALGKIGDPRAVPALIRATRDQFTRHSAAEALGNMQDPRATKALKQALKHGDVEVIVAAHRFFVRQGWRGTQKLLIKALKAKTRDYDSAMADAFINSGDRQLAAAGRWWDRRHGDGTGRGLTSEEALLASIFGEKPEHLRWGSARGNPEPSSHVRH